MTNPQLCLYNTMTQSVEPFAPADGEVVRMYTCGPTVYNPAHVGNFRTFLFVDLLRRWLALSAAERADMEEKSRGCFAARFEIRRAAASLLDAITN